jgi:hypothetical protein
MLIGLMQTLIMYSIRIQNISSMFWGQLTCFALLGKMEGHTVDRKDFKYVHLGFRESRKLSDEVVLETETHSGCGVFHQWHQPRTPCCLTTS